MTAAEKLKQIAELFSKEKKKFSEVALPDGTILVLEGDMVEGSPVMVKTETGTEPAKPGEYKLSDGSTLVIKDGGLIQEVKPAEDMKKDNEDIAALTKRIAEIEAANKATQEAATAAATANVEQMARMEKATSELIELVKEIIKNPKTDEQFSTTTKQRPEDVWAERFKRIQALNGK